MDNHNRKVLILYTSVGLGHKTIAENIGFHLGQADFVVQLADVLQLQAGFLVKFGTWLHGIINRHIPSLWRWLYMSKWFTEWTLSSRVRVASKQYHQVLREIQNFHPDVVITTQTNASAIIEYLKLHGLYTGKFVVAFSDYHLHRYWLYDHADVYLANIEEQKQEMVRFGIAAERIAVVGITLQPKPDIESTQIKKRFQFGATDKVVLILGGSQGIGFSANQILAVTRGLIIENSATRVIVVCGKNETLKRALQDAQVAGMTVLGYYSPMVELYAIANAVITKPGGLTIAELLQWNVPVLVSYWLPGQEELNYRYLVEQQLVIPRPEPFSTAALIKTASNILQDSIKKSSTFNQIRAELIQENHEGEQVIKAMQSLFHERLTAAPKSATMGTEN